MKSIVKPSCGSMRFSPLNALIFFFFQMKCYGMFSDKYMGTEYKRDKVLNKKMRYKEAI